MIQETPLKMVFTQKGLTVLTPFSHIEPSAMTFHYFAKLEIVFRAHMDKSFDGDTIDEVDLTTCDELSVRPFKAAYRSHSSVSRHSKLHAHEFWDSEVTLIHVEIC